MEEIKTIQEAIAYVQKNLPTLERDADNPFAKSKYVTLDNILKHLIPLASEIGLVIMQNPITPEIQDTNGRYAYLQIETTLMFKDEEKTLKSYVQPIELKGNLPQIFGSAVTYLKRYQLVALFGIATGEDDDAVSYNQSNMYQQQSYSNQQTKPQVDITKLNSMIAVYSSKHNMKEEDVIRNVLNSNGVQKLEDLSFGQYKRTLELLKK